MTDKQQGCGTCGGSGKETWMVPEDRPCPDCSTPKCQVCGGPPDRSGVYCDFDAFHSGDSTPKPPTSSDEATKRAHQEVEHLSKFSVQHKEYWTRYSLDVHNAIDAAVKAAEERGRISQTLSSDHRKVIEAAAADMRERAARLCAEQYASGGYSTEALALSNLIRALPLRGGNDAD